ncbi:M14 family metallopeptidase [Winogradskyella jejuensis]|uniref:Zinc carboxypeptidase n=1 Tax=Winogradskyella jejuensis TaxID=1089305 RepID=A0A1M5U1I0_9FLAO|nr:M14 metallopeptidase family protein [Winogradskyella jejuensis]SHH56503.1 Zinc carboxypeptidase [Winogradskyella jejuensis]
MDISRLSELYKIYKEKSLFGRYITLEKIAPLLKKFESDFEVSLIGYSVKQKPIHSVKVGNGPIKILLWSQMHGNESTTTKAIFDILNVFSTSNSEFKTTLYNCTLQIIPMLNPDGAERYTRLNANEVDLNRDANDLSQPESKVLRQCFDAFQPNYCFNLHGQRTIFGAGDTGKPATLSFLSPSEDQERTVTTTRKKAMTIISLINHKLQQELPNAIGRYDDGFNINCVGDIFQSLGVPTVLYEAGHYANDYDREITREYIFKAIYYGLEAISNEKTLVDRVEHYFAIPENKKNFYDVIIRNAKTQSKDAHSTDIAIQFKEVLENHTINFVPIVEKIENLDEYFAHYEIDAKGHLVLDEKNLPLKVANEIVFVMLNNRKILIKS